MFDSVLDSWYVFHIVQINLQHCYKVYDMNYTDDK
jgi:hypothetical protein